MATANGLMIIERILRDRDGVWDQIAEERELGRLIRDMLVCSAIALACYGAVLGAFNSDNAALQALLSAVKLPLLFLVTLAICLPTLYLFNLVFGARLQVRQALALVMVAITVISTLAVAFAPISLFFLITANHYAFYKLLNVAILALAALVGLRFLTRGMDALNRHNAVRDAVNRAAAEAAARPAVPALTAEQTQQAQPALTAPAVTGGDGKPAVPDAGTATPEPVPGQPVPAQPVPGQPVPGQPVPVGAAGAVGAPAGTPGVTGNGGAGTAVLVAPPMAPVPMSPGSYPYGAPGAGQRPYPGPHQGPYPGPWPQRDATAAVPVEKQASMTLLYVWILLFGFVGTQLAWTLRPFFGSPGKDFQVFRSIDGNFYVDIVRTLGQLF